MGYVSHLECVQCSREFGLDGEKPLCECGGPLLIRYDLKRLRTGWVRASLEQAPTDMWRYAPVLPLGDGGNPLTMGEGWTPLFRARRLGERLGVTNLWIKDESVNPTGSWESRAYSCVLSRLLEKSGEPEGLTVTAGANENAAVACAAYAASAGLRARVCLSPVAPVTHYLECRAYGAEICTAGFEHDPYRIEGLKTAIYEIAEQFDWQLPDAILCPPEGVLAIDKAVEELDVLGWASGTPKVIGAGPGSSFASVHRREALEAAVELAGCEGIFAAPESGACVAAVRKLVASAVINPDDRIVILNTASGSKYFETYVPLFPRSAAAEADKLGGLITPR